MCKRAIKSRRQISRKTGNMRRKTRAENRKCEQGTGRQRTGWEGARGPVPSNATAGAESKQKTRQERQRHSSEGRSKRQRASLLPKATARRIIRRATRPLPSLPLALPIVLFSSTHYSAFALHCPLFELHSRDLRFPRICFLCANAASLTPPAASDSVTVAKYDCVYYSYRYDSLSTCGNSPESSFSSRSRLRTSLHPRRPCCWEPFRTPLPKSLPEGLFLPHTPPLFSHALGLSVRDLDGAPPARSTKAFARLAGPTRHPYLAPLSISQNQHY